MVFAMTNYEIYIFCLCFIVFSIFTVLFSYMITTITKMKLKLIRNGLEDEEIIEEQNKKTATNRIATIVVKVIDVTICLAVIFAFIFSAYIGANEGSIAGDVPSLKVVKSSSMASKNENNTYLFDNNLDNQLQVFDIIVTHSVPAEDEIELYDVIVYKKDDVSIIHRVVEIEEPNESHPYARHFRFQGDAVGSRDKNPVFYSQMQGIYKGERVPFVGSFVLFLQSPAGWLCIILALFAMIATPIVEKKLLKEINNRLEVINQNKNSSNE